jgi:hypothetical protein
LSGSYADWQIVTPELLSPPDREIWRTHHADKCPGIVNAAFTGTAKEYALTLVKSANGRRYQQLLLFRSDIGVFSKVVLLAPTNVDTISVITDLPPGKYTDAEGNREVLTKYDSIALTALEAGTIQYYWNGKGFRSLSTSE